VTSTRWHHGRLESKPHEPRSRPRQQRRGPTMAGLDLGPMGLDLGSKVFFIFKN
jgi:hypothetical protein